jgi:hypothetical protein
LERQVNPWKDLIVVRSEQKTLKLVIPRPGLSAGESAFSQQRQIPDCTTAKDSAYKAKAPDHHPGAFCNSSEYDTACQAI